MNFVRHVASGDLRDRLDLNGSGGKDGAAERRLVMLGQTSTRWSTA